MSRQKETKLLVDPFIEFKIDVSGTHNVFPAYEAVVDGKVIYGEKPTAADSLGGPGFRNLGDPTFGFGGRSKSFDSGFWNFRN